MGFLDSLKAWLKTETAELADAKGDLESRLDGELSDRERRLNETPEEAMERLQQEIAENDSSLGAMEDKIGHVQAKADAVADMEAGAGETGAAEASGGPDEDILDLDSEEIE